MKTNEELRTDVSAELTWEPGIDASPIRVAAHDGVVTLTGSVPHHSSRLLAERAARRVVGVRAVVNDIVVNLPASTVKTDAEIATAVLHALDWDTQVPNDRIQVSVRDGRVTLEGTVEWAYQREAAEGAVRNLTGMVQLNNLLTVKPTAAGNEIKDKITAALRRSAEVDSRHIEVDADGGEVTLNGWVRSWVEREAAERTAWSALGVGHVRNSLFVA